MKICCVALFAFAALILLQTFSHATTPFLESGGVRQNCAVCHRLDQEGRMEVIKETRKSTEEWIHVVDRMIRLNGAQVDDKDFYPIIKELCTHLMLTPAEMAEVAYYNTEENSQYREIPKDETEVRIFTACVRCHAYGKVRGHRKTRTQWVENMNMHLGYYPTVVPQMREMDWPKEAMELAEVLAEMFPMDTPAWGDWMANRKDQDISGPWSLAGYQPGLGYYEGAYTFRSNPKKGADEYLIEKEVLYENGISMRWVGEGTLYGTYHLRYELAPTPLTGRIEGVFDLDSTLISFSGKWYTVVQDSNTYGNEAFYKKGGAPRIIAVYPRAVRASGEPQSVSVIGVNLPADVSAAGITFSDENVKVVKVEKEGDSKIVMEVVATSGAPSGPVSIQVEGVVSDEQVILFKEIDGIKIYPALGRARVSCGAAYPPQGVQFVARAVNFGKDRKPGTEDDLILEPVDAKWWLEEEVTRENDEDLKYLDTSIMNGLYTPVTTYAPIEQRFQRREGVGLIAVGASFEEGGKELKGRSRLAVTEPDFVPHIK
jgi:quinohemoprotein amine dehydrogenase